MRKALVAMTLALALVAMLDGTAFAHYCSNAHKKDGAGSSAILTIDPETFDPISYEVTKPNGKEVGGFITIVIGDQRFEVFAHNLLPDPARLAGPDGELPACDAHGIDDALACLGITIEEEAAPHSRGTAPADDETAGAIACPARRSRSG